MQMEKERRYSIANGSYSCHTNGKCSGFCNDYSVSENEKAQSLYSSSLPGAGSIEHPVSRFDTLAGVAIKYGVEVADIKKMNGLVTDFQMFALKTLQIPLPGRIACRMVPKHQEKAMPTKTQVQICLLVGLTHSSH